MCTLSFTSELVLQLYALTCGVKLLTNVILSVLFYECETAVKVKEEHGLILFKNKLLRRILGPDREEVTENTGAKFIILSKYIYIYIAVFESKRMRYKRHVGLARDL